MQTRIAVYPADTTNFDSQGLGILADTTSAMITETVQENGNVKNELELTYPIDGPLVDELRKPNLIRAPIPGGYQVFEIYDYLDDDGGTITAYAQALAYRISYFPFIGGGEIKISGTVQTVLDYGRSLVSDWPQWFDLDSDIEEKISIDDTFENFGAFLTRVMALTSGEVKQDWNCWHLLSQRGAETKLVLRDDKNTASVQVKTSYDEIINQVIPIFQVDDKDGKSQRKVGSPINAPDQFKYLQYVRGKNVDFDDEMQTTLYFERNHLNEPKLTADVSLTMTDPELDRLAPFDRVRLYNHRLKLLQSHKVVTWQYDALAEKIDNLQIGDVERNYFVSQAKSLEEETQEREEADKEADENAKDYANKAKDDANVRTSDHVQYGPSEPTNDAEEGDTWFQSADSLGTGYPTTWQMNVYRDGKWEPAFPNGYDRVGQQKTDDFKSSIDTAISDAGFDGVKPLFQAVSENGQAVTTIKADVRGIQTSVKDLSTSTSSQFTQLSSLISSRVTSDQMHAAIDVGVSNGLAGVSLSVSGGGYLTMTGTGNSSSIYMGGSNIHITGSTYIDNAVIKSAMIQSIDAGKIVGGDIRGVNTIYLNSGGDSAVMSPGYISASSTISADVGVNAPKIVFGGTGVNLRAKNGYKGWGLYVHMSDGDHHVVLD